MDKGLVHVYCGDGKGKTTAAIGLALRCAGTGKRVFIVQFLKGRPSGEINLLQTMDNVTVVRGEALTKFSWDMNEAERSAAKQQHTKMLQQAIDAAESNNCDLMLLDEAIGACNSGLLDEKALLHFIKTKPKALELVLTGRDPSELLLQTADYVTEMVKRKHPFDTGTPARKGIEF